MRPNPRFLQALGRTRLNVGRAVASSGTGERRSRAKGAGMEFADFRPYVPGDDTRHLDARLHARLGDYYVREFEVHKQLPVTVVLDASASMAFGTPEKLAAARWLANVFGYLALAGGDKVQVAFWSGSQTIVSPNFSGVGRAQRLFEWIERQQPSGNTGFEQGLADIAPKIASDGLAILISDWWMDGARELLSLIAARRAEIWAVQVLAPEELDPGSAIAGQSRLVDAESGQELALDLDERTRHDYAEALAAWRAEFETTLADLGGLFLSTTTDMDLEDYVLHHLRLRGLVGL